MDFMTAWQSKHKEFIEAHGDDFDAAVMTFELNKPEAAAVQMWLQSLIPEIMAAQKIKDPLGQDVPYYGTAGGGVTYSFLPTSLGTIITVTETITGKSLNVSDACDWYFYC